MRKSAVGVVADVAVPRFAPLLSCTVTIVRSGSRHVETRFTYYVKRCRAPANPAAAVRCVANRLNGLLSHARHKRTRNVYCVRTDRQPIDSDRMLDNHHAPLQNCEFAPVKRVRYPLPVPGTAFSHGFRALRSTFDGRKVTKTKI